MRRRVASEKIWAKLQLKKLKRAETNEMKAMRLQAKGYVTERMLERMKGQMEHKMRQDKIKEWQAEN